MKSIKALIIDNSAVGRAALTDLLWDLKNFEVVATAMEPHFAVRKIERLSPDILIINSGIAECRGMEALSDAVRSSQLPVILLIPRGGAEDASRWGMAGAVKIEFLEKPDDDEYTYGLKEALIEKISRITMIVIEVDNAKEVRTQPPSRTINILEKFSADVILRRMDPAASRSDGEKLIAIGASTGGTEVIEEILSKIPENIPGIVIALHMPGVFTRNYAERVNSCSRLRVKEAEKGDLVLRGTALIAPGDRHMLLRNTREGYAVEINDGLHVNRHRPSIDVLFRSACNTAGKSCIGILCTGMGYDGASGLLEIREAGGFTIAQDEASCIVFGMPREAIKLGAAVRVLDVNGIIEYLKSLQLN